ncbi:MAG: alpha/beta hydrolase [Salinarimonas sp.]|nr:alpha/beta hydrolase [Salinarimonas sp.]
METMTINGGGGLALQVRRYGTPGGKPIVFLHGWSQHHLAFAQQYAGPLAGKHELIGLDLRGHGASDAPEGAQHYGDGDLWADDLHAVITQLGLVSPIIVAWSYGGLVVADYLRKYGDAALGGVNFVGAALVIGKEYIGSHTGETFVAHASKGMSKDPVKALYGMIDFVHACAVKPVPQETVERFIAFNMLVRPDVRRAVSARDADYRPVLADLRKPALFTHGTADTVIMPRMSEETAAIAPDSRISWYEGAGHMPFIEDQARFDTELAAFAETA